MTLESASSRTIFVEVADRDNKPLQGAVVDQHVDDELFASLVMGHRAIRFQVSPAQEVRFVAKYNGLQRQAAPTSQDHAYIRFDEVSLSDRTSGVPGWFPVAGVAFALLTVVSLFYLIVQARPIVEGNRVLLDIWVAICLAASTSFIGGTATAQGAIPLPFVKQSPSAFSAVGGFGVVIVALIVLVNVFR
jgi:hypothetical protein